MYIMDLLGYPRLATDKYIKEKGIIFLIDTYANFCVNELFKMLYNNATKIYSIEHHMKRSAKPFDYSDIIICILTKNSFVIIDSPPYSYNNCVYEIKFNKNKIYKKMLINSMNLSKTNFLDKYTSIINNSTYDIIKSQKNNLYKLLQKYDAELYNIKMQVFFIDIYDYYDKKLSINECINKFVLDINNIFPAKMKNNIIIKCIKTIDPIAVYFDIMIYKI
jgi:hypothetical protein